MKTATVTKIHHQHTKSSAYRYHIQRDMQAWEALRGIWKNKKIGNVMRWQKQIRNEWERRLPKLKIK